MADEKSRQIHHLGRLARITGHYVACGRPVTIEACR